jgi:hypothetical protein
VSSDESKAKLFHETLAFSEVTSFVEELCGGARNSTLLEHQGTHLVYRVAKGVASLGQMFAAIEANRVRLCIREYSISETTLEQIFIQFARRQHVIEES